VATPVKERLYEAALAVVEEQGLDELTMEGVARRAGTSRATVYRHLPGGRDQLVSETVAWEVGRFLDRLTEATDQVDGLAARLEVALVESRHAIEGHAVLQHVLADERERAEVLPSMGQVMPIALGVLRAWLVPQLASQALRPGQTVDGAADHLARMLLSFMGSAGSWDLDDPDQLHRLVHQDLLGPILLPA